MLKKLIKQEFRETYRLMITLNLLIVLMTIVGAVIMNCKFFHSPSLILMDILMAVIYFVAIVSIGLFTMLYVVVTFYKTMYGARSYLTHTLPVSTMSIFNSKVIAGTSWIFVNAIMISISVGTLLKVFFNVLGMKRNVEFDSIAREVFGISQNELIFWGLAIIFITSLAGTIISFFCIATGQLFPKHKIAGAILCYILYYIINQSVAFMITLFTANVNTISAGNMDNVYLNENIQLVYGIKVNSIYGPMILGDLIYAIIMAVIAYALCVYYMKKKINLD